MPQLKFQHSSQRVALRSNYDINGPMAWFVGNPSNGGSWVSNDYVKNPSWIDVPIPEET